MYTLYNLRLQRGDSCLRRNGTGWCSNEIPAFAGMAALLIS
ncbi:MAG: hypothetical protein ACR2QC_12730 [Gammaproteobacteria bacterium]